jgi:hypothetical protein
MTIILKNDPIETTHDREYEVCTVKEHDTIRARVASLEAERDALRAALEEIGLCADYIGAPGIASIAHRALDATR